MGKKRKTLSSLEGKNEIPKEQQDKLKGGKKIKKWGNRNGCGNIVPQ
jgi:hypothetical protein